MNGLLGSLFRGAHHISQQIMENFQIQKATVSAIQQESFHYEFGICFFEKAIPNFSTDLIRVFEEGQSIDPVFDAFLKKTFSFSPHLQIFQIRNLYYKSVFLNTEPRKLTRLVDHIVYSQLKTCGFIQTIYLNRDHLPHVILKVKVFPLTIIESRKVDNSFFPPATAYYLENNLNNSGKIEFWDLFNVHFKAGYYFDENSAAPPLIALSPNLVEIH